MHTDELSQNAMGGTEIMGHGLYSRLPKDLLDQFQIIRSRARELDPSKKKIFWAHDLAEDPEVRHLSIPTERAKYDKIVFVSNWQQQQYNSVLGVPYSDGVVLENAIDPISSVEKPTDQIRIIYHSTPHRGLELLLPVFDKLSETHSNIVLDVYSSFKLYGWPERDKQYQLLFDMCEKHPKINYHGSVDNVTIRSALQQAHIFAFPSIWPETSCLCLIEAMSAGVACVHPNLAALPETSSGLTWSYGVDQDKTRHAANFAVQLDRAIQLFQDDSTKAGIKQNLALTKLVADVKYGWNHRVLQWNTFLQSMLTK